MVKWCGQRLRVRWGLRVGRVKWRHMLRMSCLMSYLRLRRRRAIREALRCMVWTGRRRLMFDQR